MAERVLTGPAAGFDLRYAYWRAGRQVLFGFSPYAWTHAQVASRIAFVYPALSAVLFAPLALLARGVASVGGVLACIALVPATLFVLGVRDRRVYAVALMWLPVYSAWQTANETMLLTFGLACAWRWRAQPWVVGVLTGIMLSLKPLTWPVLLWMVASRRWRASLIAVVSGTVLNLLAWSLVGWDQISRYVAIAGADVKALWRTGWGIPAFAGHLGLGEGPAIVLMLVLTLVAAVPLVSAAHAQRDGRALVWVIVISLVSSPLLWSHYLALFLVPLSLLRPRMHWVWLLPLVMWVSPLGMPVHLWQLLVCWMAAGGLIHVLLRS